jgi:CBS domain containing-hemolysin-like protein
LNPTASIALAATTAIVGSLFAAADAAVTSISDPRLDVLAQTERPFARYEKERTTVLARWLVGRVSSIGLSAVVFDDAFEHLFDLSMPLAPAAATVLVYATFAEVLGSIARQRPEATARRFLVWLWPLEMVVAAIAMPLSLLGRFVTSQVDEERVHDPVSAEAELENAVTGLEESGTIAEEPAAMIRNVLEFQEQTAKEVMVPRRLMAGIELKTPLSEVIELVAKDGH